MPYLFLVSFASLFTFLTIKNFRFAVQLFIVTLPAYVIRFSFGPLPSTLLEVEFAIIAIVWLLSYAKNDLPTIQSFFKSHRAFGVGLTAFFLASIAGIFISDMWFYSLGQWRAYFLEPIILFLIILGRREQITSKDLALALIISTVSISVVGIVQKIFGIWYPPSLWDDVLFGRVTSFFTSPNAVGLYLAPLIILAVLFWENLKIKLVTVIAVGLALITLILTRSLGAWLALIAGIIIFILALGYKKTATSLVVLGLFLALLPPVKNVLLSKEKSGENRLILWSYSWNYLTESPKNFIFGAGIRQFFRKVQKPHYEPKEIERLIYPHNILLNFWTETGLVGMISFTTILGMLFAAAKNIQNTHRLAGAVFLAALTIFVVHGLIDVPYFKNDLAFLFWIVAGCIFIYKKNEPARFNF